MGGALHGGEVGEGDLHLDDDVRVDVADLEVDFGGVLVAAELEDAEVVVVERAELLVAEVVAVVPGPALGEARGREVVELPSSVSRTETSE